MTKTQYLLVKIAEEAAEVAQMALKTAHFGVHEKENETSPSNLERLCGELNDLLAVVDMFGEEIEEDIVLDGDKMEAKKKKVEHFMKYSQSQGLVDE